MVVNTSDPRSLRSIDALLEAAYDLIDAKPLSAISITDVVVRAGVSRPTFYQYFKDIRGLAQHAAMERVQVDLPLDPALAALEAANLSPEQRRSHVAERAGPILNHLQAHHRFYLAVFDEAGDLGFFADLASFISTRVFDLSLDQSVPGPGQIEAHDRARFLSHGILWTVIAWLKSDFAADNDVTSMSRRLASVIVGASATLPWPAADISKAALANPPL